MHLPVTYFKVSQGACGCFIPAYTQVYISKLYVHLCLTAELTQASCDCIVLVALDKPSISNVQRSKDLEKLKKLFGLSLLRGKDKNTFIRAIASALIQHAYVEVDKNAELANLSRDQLKTVKKLEL